MKEPRYIYQRNAEIQNLVQVYCKVIIIIKTSTEQVTNTKFTKSNNLCVYSRTVMDSLVCRVSRRMRWGGHVARMGEERGCIGSWWGNRREGDHWGDLGVDGWIILGWISRRWDVGVWTGLGWPRIETGGGRL